MLRGECYAHLRQPQFAVEDFEYVHRQAPDICPKARLDEATHKLGEFQMYHLLRQALSTNRKSMETRNCYFQYLALARMPTKSSTSSQIEVYLFLMELYDNLMEDYKTTLYINQILILQPLNIIAILYRSKVKIRQKKWISSLKDLHRVIKMHSGLHHQLYDGVMEAALKTVLNEIYRYLYAHQYFPKYFEDVMQLMALVANDYDKQVRDGSIAAIAWYLLCEYYKRSAGAAGNYRKDHKKERYSEKVEHSLERAWFCAMLNAWDHSYGHFKLFFESGGKIGP
jgi:hypothetical protein